MVTDRIESTREAILAEVPDAKFFEAIALNAPDGLKATQSLLQAHPEMKVIICCTDDGALGARSAYQNSGLDADGPAVYDLVMEVTIRTVDGVREPKRDYLLRIMLNGSARAKTLKLADRNSNLTALGFVHDTDFVRRYLAETEACILPYAEQVDPNMLRELSDLVENRRRLLPLV